MRTGNLRRRRRWIYILWSKVWLMEDYEEGSSLGVHITNLYGLGVTVGI